MVIKLKLIEIKTVALINYMNSEFYKSTCITKTADVNFWAVLRNNHHIPINIEQENVHCLLCWIAFFQWYEAKNVQKKLSQFNFIHHVKSSINQMVYSIKKQNEFL